MTAVLLGPVPAAAQKIIHVEPSPFRINPLDLKVTKSFGGALILRVRPAKKPKKIRKMHPGKRVRKPDAPKRAITKQQVQTDLPGSRLPRSQRVQTDLPGTRLPPSQRVQADLFPARVIKFGKVANERGIRRVIPKKGRFGKKGFVGFSLPQQTYFPPYYKAPHGWARGPDLESRIEGGKTVRQGSPFASRIEGGKTVVQGSPYASRIRGGKTVERGSRYASRIKPGLTVEGGSPWASKIPNWKFSGYAAPMRPRGIPYYKANRRKRAPWASRY